MAEAEAAWMMQVDGSVGARKGGCGIFIKGPHEEELEYAVKLDSEVTNNEAEYEAAVQGLEIAYNLRVRNLIVYTDSQLVAMQVEGSYEAKEVKMNAYFQRVRALMKKFALCKLHQIPGEENHRADSYQNLGQECSG